MNDTYQRRNRIAALVLQYHADNIARLAKDAPSGHLPSDVVLRSYTPVLNALGGIVDPSQLGVDPLSLTAVKIAVLTTDPIQEIP